MNHRLLVLWTIVCLCFAPSFSAHADWLQSIKNWVSPPAKTSASTALSVPQQKPQTSAPSTNIKTLSSRDVATLLKIPSKKTILLPDYKAVCFEKAVITSDGIWNDSHGNNQSLSSLFPADQFKNVHCRKGLSELSSFTVRQLDKNNLRVLGAIIDEQGNFYLPDEKEKISAQENVIFYPVDKELLSQVLAKAKCGNEDKISLSAETTSPAEPTPTKTPGATKIAPERHYKSAQNISKARIAVEVDFPFYSLYCPQPGLAQCSLLVADHMASLLSTVNVVYQRDVNAVLQIGFLKIWDDQDPFQDPDPTNDTDPLLDSFTSYWRNPNNNRVNINRAVAHLVSGRFTGGRATVSGLCNKENGYGKSGVTGPNSLFLGQNKAMLRAYNQGLISTVAHELGHNFGSEHDHWYGEPESSCFTSDPPSCTALPFNCCGLENDLEGREGEKDKCLALLYHGDEELQATGESEGDIMSYCPHQTLEFYPRVQQKIEDTVAEAECLEVLHNQAPQIQNLNAIFLQQDRFSENTQYELNLQLADPNQNQLYFFWDWREVGQEMMLGSTITTTSHISVTLPAKEIQATCTVFDQWGSNASANIIIDLRYRQGDFEQHEAPQIGPIEYDQAQAFIENPIEFNTSVTSREDENLNYQLTFDVSWSFEDEAAAQAAREAAHCHDRDFRNIENPLCGNSNFIVDKQRLPQGQHNRTSISRYTFSQVGEHIVKVRSFACDSSGECSPPSTREITVNVINPPPRIDALRIPAQTQAGVETEMFAVAADPNRENIFFNWSFGDNTANLQTGPFSPADAGRGVAVRHNYHVAAGSYIVTLVATDASRNRSRPIQTPIQILNATPVINRLTFTGRPQAGSPMRFIVEAQDANLDPLSYEWRFSDGSSARTNVPNIDHTFAQEPLEVTVIVTDNHQASTSRTRTFTMNDMRESLNNSAQPNQNMNQQVPNDPQRNY